MTEPVPRRIVGGRTIGAIILSISRAMKTVGLVFDGVLRFREYSFQLSNFLFAARFFSRRTRGIFLRAIGLGIGSVRAIEIYFIFFSIDVTEGRMIRRVLCGEEEN